LETAPCHWLASARHRPRIALLFKDLCERCFPRRNGAASLKPTARPLTNEERITQWMNRKVQAHIAKFTQQPKGVCDE